MDELEILKKDWDSPEKENFKDYSEEEIYSMIHKSSVNVAKRLIFIAVLEIVFFNAVLYFSNVFFHQEGNNFPKRAGILKIVEDYHYYAIIAVFLLLLFIFNKRIEKAQEPKELKKLILYMRRIVLGYIIIVFSTYTFGFIEGGLSVFNDGENVLTHPISKILFWVLFLVITAGLFWGFYKLYTKFIYKQALKLFKINYDELVKLEKRK